MPGRHSPPPVVDKPATEKLKRPKKNGAANKGARGIQRLLFEETDSTAHRLGPPEIDTPPVTLNTPADTSPLASTQEGPPGLPVSTSGNDPSPALAEEPRLRPGIITVGGIDFHHQSEAEFARLLNYYAIEWLYEPHQFPLQWRDDRPIEMFSPDFYLVEYDFYIELTTMRQALVRKKNRKLRLLRALYPELNVKLLYRRDYHRLLERFGIKPEDADAGSAPHENSLVIERDTATPETL